MQTNAENVIESIRQLPPPEQEMVWHWLDEKRKPREWRENWNGRIEKFHLAMRWIDEHRREYLGQWVCLDGDELIAHGSDARQVYTQAKEKGVRIPFIEQVREPETSPYWGGWD